MTVAELINKLQTMPQHVPVVLSFPDDCQDIDIVAQSHTHDKGYTNWMGYRYQNYPDKDTKEIQVVIIK